MLWHCRFRIRHRGRRRILPTRDSNTSSTLRVGVAAQILYEPISGNFGPSQSRVVRYWPYVGASAMSKRVEITQFSEIELSDDGRAVIVTAELSDKAVVKWEVPYRHAIWLARATLSVA